MKTAPGSPGPGPGEPGGVVGGRDHVGGGRRGGNGLRSRRGRASTIGVNRKRSVKRGD